jgi:hypothetical protein
MEKSDKIIDDLQRIILMLSRENTQMKAYLRESCRGTQPGKTATTALCHLRKMRTDHCVPAVSGKKVVESDFPAHVDSPVKYGKGIESLIGYLSVRQYLPFKRLQEMLSDIFAVQISEGGLHCLLKRLASKDWRVS